MIFAHAVLHADNIEEVIVLALSPLSTLFTLIFSIMIIVSPQ